LSRLGAFFAVAGCILAAATFAEYYSARVIAWAVMTDELQTTKLATSIAETGSLVPRIHGSYYGALSQLYPLLTAPFYGLMRPPPAATAAHALNPFLLASAAWPAYLFARSVTASRAAGCAVAMLTAFTPWLVLSTTLLRKTPSLRGFCESG
jgi:predicted membrane-bound spermidine synthase